MAEAQGRGGPGVGAVVRATSALANLLPTGTVLAFQALAPSFSNSGTCRHGGGGFSNTLLTASLVAVCSLACVLSSFTDSFTTSDGRLLHGIATFKGFYVFNAAAEDGDDSIDLSRYKIKGIDYIHAVASLVVFLVVSVGDHDVFRCFFPEWIGVVGENQLFVNLPLGVGVLASYVFVVFPTTRRGIGSPMPPA